jgi:hypothetical protein
MWSKTSGEYAHCEMRVGVGNGSSHHHYTGRRTFGRRTAGWLSRVIREVGRGIAKSLTLGSHAGCLSSEQMAIGP